jgi:hypothetical protein
MNLRTLQKLIVNAMRRVQYKHTSKRLGGFLHYVRRVDNKSSVYGQRFFLKISDTVPTACWRYNHAKNRHEIQVGLDCVKIANRETKSDVAKVTNFHKEVLRHEIGHALFTERSNDVVEKLNDENIPFNLFNLFEDCRIEFLLTKNYPQFKKFFWFKYLDFSDSVKFASEAILNLKHKESMIRVHGSKSNSLMRFCPMISQSKPTVEYFYNDASQGNIKTKKAICNYYERACNAVNSMAVVQILKDFIQSFGLDVPSVYVYENVHNGVEDKNAKKIQSKHYAKQDDDGCSNNCEWSDITSTNHVDESNVRYSKTIANSLRPLIKKFGRVRGKVSTRGSRLHLKNAIARCEQMFKMISSTKGKPTITMLIDFSGSMRDTWTANGGREFVSAFQILSEQNLINFNPIYSKDGYGYLLKNHSINDIMSIRTNGSHEALDNNLKRFFPMVKNSDVVLLFTDGFLTGNIVNEKEYREQKIDLIACCIPNESDVEKVRKYCNGYFTKSYIDTSAIGLAKRVVQHTLEKTKV